MAADDPLEMASALEIDSILLESVACHVLLKDAALRRSCSDFNTFHQSLSSLLALNLMVLLFSVPFAVNLSLSLSHCWSFREYLYVASSLTILATENIVLWKVYLHHKQLILANGGQMPRKVKKFLQSFQMGIYLFNSVGLCCRLLMKVINGQCDHLVPGDWSCNPLADVGAIPQAGSLLVMLLPILYAVTVRGAHFTFTMALWLLSMATLVVAVAYGDARNSVFFVTYYAIGSLLAIVEIRRINYFIFFTHRKLQAVLNEKSKEADETNASEMRHMIANVAHDLKTPLASFLGGIEFISQVISDMAVKQAHVMTAADLQDCIHSVQHAVTNMKNTNSFMLMTINRCIDYTKASKGVKLVPKFETIDLAEALSLPLNCMKDIQQTVSIALEPVCEHVCSHIITDKQWLQENVLCLLSNAVKYSNGGSVNVTVRKVQVDSGSVEEQLELNKLLMEQAAKERQTCPKSPTFRALESYRLDRSKIYASEQPAGQDDAHEPVQVPVIPKPCSKKSPRRAVRPEIALEQADMDGMRELLDAEMSHKQSTAPMHPLSTTVESRSWPSTEKAGAQRPMLDYLRVEVEDHGIGLSDEAMATLFNPFKQAQRLAGGTGLGLFSLAKRIEALDGLCGVQRRQDGAEGSMFWFEIPYRPDHQFAKMLVRSPGSSFCRLSPSLSAGTTTSTELGGTESAGAQSGEPSPTCAGIAFPPPIDIQNASSPQQSESLCILVVDDSPAILKMTSMMLKRHKHQVSTATNGAEAVKMVTERIQSTGKGFDVVLMDLQMPVMDGLEATRRLRAWEAGGCIGPATTPKKASLSNADSDKSRTGSLPPLDSKPGLTDTDTLQAPTLSLHQLIIGVSANSDHQTSAEAFQMGVDAFIAKPFALDTFYRTYDELIEQTHVE